MQRKPLPETACLAHLCAIVSAGDRRAVPHRIIRIAIMRKSPSHNLYVKRAFSCSLSYTDPELRQRRFQSIGTKMKLLGASLTQYGLNPLRRSTFTISFPIAAFASRVDSAE